MKQKIEEKTPLKVLYLEDSPKDVEIIRELLLDAGYDLSLVCTDNKIEFTSLLHKNQYDIILSDFSLPGFDAFGALQLHNEICPDIPFICVSGSIGEEIAIELIMKGAVDYVLKDRLVRLPSAIKRVLNEVKEKNLLAKVEEELQENQKRFSSIFNASPIGTTITRISDGKIIEANPAITTILGYPHDELIGRTTTEINVWVNIEQRDTMLKLLREKGAVHDFETRGRRKSGEIIDLLVSAEMIELSGTKCLLSLFHNITERKRMDKELQNSETKYRMLYNQMTTGLAVHEIILDDKGQPVDYCFLQVNPAFEKLTGLRAEIILGKTVLEVMPNTERFFIERYGEVALTGKDIQFESYSQELKKYFNIRAYSPERGKFATIFEDVTEHKRAEEELHIALSKYKTLFECFPLGITVSDKMGRIVETNSTAEKLLGLPKEEQIRRDIESPEWHIVRADGTPMPPEEYVSVQAMKQKRKVENAEMGIVKPDNTITWINVTAAPLPLEDHGVVITYNDITMHKKAEDALRESELQFRELWRATVEGIAIFDNGIIIEVNDAMCQMLGYTREYALGKSLLEFAPAEVRDEIIERITTKREGRFEIPAMRIDGTIILLETFVKQIMYKGKPARMITARDITEQKKSEMKLRENEQFFRLLFTTSPDSILIFDPFSTAVPWEILDCNEVACRMNGYTREELIGKSIDMLNANSLKPEEREAHIKRLQQKGVVYFETFHRHRDGHVFPIDVASSIVTLGGRQLILGIDRDITVRKQAEDALRQMQKLEGLGTLAGGIAHDFNNILGIILAYNTGIMRYKDDEKKLNLATETITKAVDRGKTLVQQILTFARKTETAFGAVNVNDVVMEIMTMILETFPKTLTYAQNFEKGLPYINADRTQLYQALLNLCVNARDAMPNGGMLAINTRMLPGADLTAKHPDVTDNNYICIEVSDTGEGMTEEVKKRIFEPFFTTKGIGKGTGLGLAVVFGVIQTHKGFVDVESEIGKGTTFKLYLPALKVEEPISEKEEESLEEIRGGTETLLVVEDEEMLMMSLQMLLVEKGYNVLPARDGLEALKIYQENKNDIAVVLTDLGLPTITGLEVCQRIRKIKSNERVILATGYLDPEMKAEFLKAGIQHFLYKPYEMIKVLKVIREVLDEK